MHIGETNCHNHYRFIVFELLCCITPIPIYIERVWQISHLSCLFDVFFLFFFFTHLCHIRTNGPCQSNLHKVVMILMSICAGDTKLKYNICISQTGSTPTIYKFNRTFYSKIKPLSLNCFGNSKSYQGKTILLKCCPGVFQFAKAVIILFIYLCFVNPSLSFD